MSTFQIFMDQKPIEIAENYQSGSPTQKQQLADLIRSLDGSEGRLTFRPGTNHLSVDGRNIDVDNLRTWIAVGYGDSSSTVSDQDVLEAIAKGGLSGSTAFMLEMLKTLPTWNSSVASLTRMIEKGNSRESAAEIQKLYVDKRGTMVVDVIASRRRRYESQVRDRILPEYARNAKDASLKALSEDEPTYLRLRNGESRAMSNLATFLLTFSDGGDDEDTVANFAKRSDDWGVRHEALAIKGVGPVLYEYLRLLSGVDTLKPDSRVRHSLYTLGFPVHWFSDEGVLQLCMQLAAAANCSLVELDQALWFREADPR